MDQNKKHCNHMLIDQCLKHQWTNKEANKEAKIFSLLDASSLYKCVQFYYLNTTEELFSSKKLKD